MTGVAKGHRPLTEPSQLQAPPEYNGQLTKISGTLVVGAIVEDIAARVMSESRGVQNRRVVTVKEWSEEYKGIWSRYSPRPFLGSTRRETCTGGPILAGDGVIYRAGGILDGVQGEV